MDQSAIIKQDTENYGPYGSKSANTYSLQLEDGQYIKEVIIKHGAIVDAFGVVVAKPDETTITYQFGGDGPKVDKIVLKNDEYLTSISGTFGNYKYQNNQVLIGTLKIHTNLNPDGYGPYGQDLYVTNVEEFASPDMSGYSIVGFFGRSNKYLESVGVSTIKHQENYGPYGSKFANTYSLQLEDGQYIKEVIIKHGAIVDAFGVVVAKPDETTIAYQFGGDGPKANKIVLKNDEYLTSISGTFGNYKYQNNQVLIGTLKIHTNLNPDGYGPYGQDLYVTNVEEFASPDMSGYSIVGFFGRSNKYLESVGVSTIKVIP